MKCQTRKINEKSFSSQTYNSLKIPLNGNGGKPMMAEYTLKYRVADQTEDYTATCEVSCLTELENLAYAALKQSGAELVNFNYVNIQ